MPAIGEYWLITGEYPANIIYAPSNNEKQVANQEEYPANIGYAITNIGEQRTNKGELAANDGELLANIFSAALPCNFTEFPHTRCGFIRHLTDKETSEYPSNRRQTRRLRRLYTSETSDTKEYADLMALYLESLKDVGYEASVKLFLELYERFTEAYTSVLKRNGFNRPICAGIAIIWLRVIGYTELEARLTGDMLLRSIALQLDSDMMCIIENLFPSDNLESR